MIVRCEILGLRVEVGNPGRDEGGGIVVEAQVKCKGAGKPGGCDGRDPVTIRRAEQGKPWKLGECPEPKKNKKKK